MHTYIEHPNAKSIHPDYAKFMYLTENLYLKITRGTLLDWFTIRRGVPVIDDIPLSLKGASVIISDNHPDMKFSIVHVKWGDETYVYGVSLEVNLSEELRDTTFKDRTPCRLTLLRKGTDVAPYSMYDKFMMKAGMALNYASGPDVLTDVGKFFLNTILLCKPFGDKIPYINERINPSTLDKKVATLIKNGEAGRKEYDAYIGWGYWYGNDGSIATQLWTKKSLTTDPNIKKRKAELFEKHKHELHDPVVMTAIEKELVDMDREWIKGDPSEMYFNAVGPAAHADVRRKAYIGIGLTPAFDKNTGSYELVEESLHEGWTAKNIPVMSNSIRRSSYQRGKKTGEGGSMTKETGRVVQGVAITMDDCGSKRGLQIAITEKVKGEYDLRVLTDGTVLTADNIDKYVGKTVSMRAPQRCSAPDGLCHVCCGLTFKNAGITNVGIQVLSVTADFMQVAMKAMHKSSVTSMTIDSITPYLK